MSHKLKFQVEIDFTDSVWFTEHQKEVHDNIMRALVSDEEHGMGIAPENSEAITERITIRSGQRNASTTYNFNIIK
jgi:hypothetical protein